MAYNEERYLLLAINRWKDEKETRRFVIAPSGGDVIQQGDTLVVFGADAKLQAFEKDALAATFLS